MLTDVEHIEPVRLARLELNVAQDALKLISKSPLSSVEMKADADPNISLTVANRSVSEKYRGTPCFFNVLVRF